MKTQIEDFITKIEESAERLLKEAETLLKSPKREDKNWGFQLRGRAEAFQSSAASLTKILNKGEMK